jgi:hypothetical protein
MPTARTSARSAIASSTILVATNDAGRTVVGFDASKVEQYSDARRVFREYSHVNLINDILEQRRKMLGRFGGIDLTLRSFGGIDQMAREDSVRSQGLRLARLAGANLVGTNTAGVYADLAKRIVPESMRLELPESIRNLATSIGHYSPLLSNAPRYGKMFGNMGLSRSVSQALKMQGLASAYSSAWSLHRVPPMRTPAIQALLKSMPTFGPIVVSPDDAAPPSNYHPDLQGWLIPDTATDSGDAIDVEELVDIVFAYVLGIAQHHRTRVLVTVVGKHGGTFLIRVAENTVAGLLVYWLLSR